MSEYQKLPAATKAVVDKAIADVERTGTPVNVLHENGNIYAHPHPGGGVSWGVNGGENGFNIARGIKR